MQIESQTAFVTGAGSGLGQATALALAAAGARVAVVDRDADAAARTVALIGAAGGHALACPADITDEAAVTAALDACEAAFGTPRVLMNVAGIGTAKRVIGKDGTPAPQADFERVIRVNLLGTWNVTRLAAARMARLAPAEGTDGERGMILMTASVAAFDGQVGQEAYAASKAALVGLTLPLARDLAQHGIRVVTVAPGLFATPLMQELPEAVQQGLAASIPFPKRLGRPEEFASLALEAVRNGHLNGEVIRLDGALRMAPR